MNQKTERRIPLNSRIVEKVKSDKKFVVLASGLAQKVVDYILDHQDSNSKPVLSSSKKKKSKSASLSMNF